MLTVRPYTESDREAWDRFVLGTEGSHPAQLSDWIALTEQTYGVGRRAWLAREGEQVRGLLPLFTKSRLGRAPVLFSPPGGLLASDEGTAEALLAVARDQLVRERLGYIELRDQLRRWPGLVTSEEHCTHVLPLASDAAAQWEVFDAKLRNQIRKAERAGFTIRRGADQVSAFCRVMLERMRDLGTPMRAEPYYRRLLDALGERAVLLVIARQGEPVGTMLLAIHRGAAMDLWAASLGRHFAHCPNQMLYWTAIQDAISRGLVAFDFGRSQWDTGTYRFKEQWGARAVPLHYQYLLGPAASVPTFASQRRRLDLAAQLWKRLPLAVARVLGDPIRRRFPELL